MKEKFIFREMLREIKELADQKGNVLTEEEVRSFFADAGLEEEQLKLVFDYLDGQNIQILGYTEKQENPEEEAKEWSEEESEYLSFYEEELQNIREISEEEKIQLFCDAAQGDALAKGRLIEVYLPTVARIAREYEKKELPLGDLIQEGNVGLMMAVDDLHGITRILDADTFLERQIREAMKEAMELQRDSRHAGDEIAGRVNHLNEAIQNLEEDLERKISIEELSAYLEMPTEEIQDILRMAGDEIELESPHHHGHSHGHSHEESHSCRHQETE